MSLEKQATIESMNLDVNASFAESLFHWLY